MESNRLMFAGIFGLALSAGCAAPDAASEPHSGEKIGTTTSAMTTFQCSCADMPGTWTGSYSSAQEAIADIGVYCRYGGSCSDASSNSSPDSANNGSPTGGYGSPGGTYSSTSGGGTGSNSGSTDPSSSSGGSGGGTTTSGGAPANSSDIPRDGTFRTTDDSWNFFYTYHHERSEAGFNDGDSVRFFDSMKEVKNVQNFNAFSALIPGIPYAVGVAMFALGKLSDAQIDAIAQKYAETGRQQGIRVVNDVTTDMMVGRTENYLIYNISDGALLGQISIVYPSLVSAPTDPNGCQYGTYGDVGLAVQSCSNGIKACSAGYNCM